MPALIAALKPPIEVAVTFSDQFRPLALLVSLISSNSLLSRDGTCRIRGLPSCSARSKAARAVYSNAWMADPRLTYRRAIIRSKVRLIRSQAKSVITGPGSE